MDNLWENSFAKCLLSFQERFTEDLSSVTGAVDLALVRLISDDPAHGPGAAVSFAANLLDLFCQLNWTGPPLADFALPSTTPDVLSKWNTQSLQALSWDGEPVYPLVQQPHLLQLAHTILVENSNTLGEKVLGGDVRVRWALRCLFLEQRLLDQRSATLWKKISELIEKEVSHLTQSGRLSAADLSELHLELGHICLFYSRYDEAQKHFEDAQPLVHLSMDLTGALGKRTKFQQSNIAQLLLRATAGDSKEPLSEVACPNLPKDLKLGDDTLLDQVQFADQQTTPLLSGLQQAVILGQCTCLRKTSPVHRLTTEGMEAYVNCVLGTPRSWVGQSVALLLRSQLEAKRRRAVERAMMQLQVLVDSFSAPTPEAKHRLQLLYCLPLPPHWVIERELASVLVSLGSVQSALEIYERLEMWTEVVECLSAGGRKGRAEEVVRGRLAVAESPVMWCLLGDVTQDPEYYLKAWELSNHHSARAQRSLGKLYLKQEKYQECIESLQLSLQVNSIQEGLWFTLGCAASRIKDSDLAAKAFHRCVTLEPDHGEAWSNLAAVYIRRKDKVRAFRAYQEAIKCSYDNWKMWENLLIVSVDVGEFEEALKSYHRLLDLREKFVDIEVLQHLVSAVVQGLLDRSGQSATRLRRRVGELLGRITSQTTSSADVWKLYADYHFASDSLEDQTKGLLELQKAQRATRLESGWEKELAKLEKVVDFTLEYSQACRRMCATRGGQETARDLSSAKLALQGVISKAKNFGLSSSETVERLVEKMEAEMQQLLKCITS